MAGPPPPEEPALPPGVAGGAGVRPSRATAMRELLAFVPDVVRLLYALSRDPRVPRRAKLAALGALTYVVSPVDVLPDVIPVVGRLDDVWLVARALRFLVGTAGYDVVHELWGGSDDGFALLLVAAGVRR